MPSVNHRVVVDAPIVTTWGFVKEMENWAPLLPGYDSFRQVTETDSEWRVKGDVGILTKLVTMKVHITDWVDLSHVSFDVVCVEEPLKGNGKLTAAAGEEATTLDFDLTAEAGGMLGPVVNALLRTVMPRIARDFAGAIKREIEAGRPAAGDPAPAVGAD